MNMQIAGAYHNYFLIRSKNTSLNEALCGYMRHESNTHSDKTLIARFLFDLFSVVSSKIFSSVIIFTSNYKLPGTITRNAHTPVLQSLLESGYLYNVDIMQHSKHHFTQRYQMPFLRYHFRPSFNKGIPKHQVYTTGGKPRDILKSKCQRCLCAHSSVVYMHLSYYDIDCLIGR